MWVRHGLLILCLCVAHAARIGEGECASEKVSVHAEGLPCLTQCRGKKGDAVKQCFKDVDNYVLIGEIKDAQDKKDIFMALNMEKGTTVNQKALRENWRNLARKLGNLNTHSSTSAMQIVNAANDCLKKNKFEELDCNGFYAIPNLLWDDWEANYVSGCSGSKDPDACAKGQVAKYATKRENTRLAEEEKAREKANKDAAIAKQRAAAAKQEAAKYDSMMKSEIKASEEERRAAGLDPHPNAQRDRDAIKQREEERARD